MYEDELELPDKHHDLPGGKRQTNWIPLILAIIIAAGSIFLAPYLSSPKRSYYSDDMEQFNDSRNTVMELMAASTATSTAITFLHDDWGYPIAEKLADLSTGFLVVLTAVFVEKYLLTTILYVTLLIGVPFLCLAFALSIYRSDEDKRDRTRAIAWKLLVFLVALNICIPGSVEISGLIQNTYKTSIDETISEARGIAQEIEDVDSDEESDEEQGVIDGLISKVSGVAEDITSGATALVEKAKNCLNNFIEALAILIVTSCVIPLIVLFIILAIIKAFWGLDVMSSVQNAKLPKAGSRRRAKSTK